MTTLKQELNERIKRNIKVIDILQKEKERDKIMLKEIEELNYRR